MKMKKLICASLALVMAVGMLAGCGGPKGSEAAENFSDSNEKLTISWLGYPRNPGSEEGTIPELAIEEKFNVDIKPLFYEENKFNDKKTMLMAGGEIPDLVYEMDPANVVQDVDQDFIVELPYETIEKYAPEYFKYINEYVPAAWLYSRYEGKNWGLPNYNHTHMVSKNAVWRKDWLDKFGLEAPKTLDEMHDALYKFTFEDPDGNGKKDTYGYNCNGGTYQNFFGEIFGAYGCLPFDWVEKDGKIVYGGLTDECKEVLTLLAQWYKEGIIHPDFAVGLGNYQKLFSGEIGYMFDAAFYDYDHPNSVPSKVKEINSNAELAIGFLPTGPEGLSGTRAWGRACHVVSFGNTDGYGVKVPRILKIFDEVLTNEEFAMTLHMGKEGETYEAAPENTTTNYKWQFTEEYNDGSKPRLSGLSEDFAGPTMFAPIPVKYDTWESLQSKAYKEYRNTWTDEKYSLTGPFFKTDIVPSAADYLVDLRTKQMSIMAEIIMGKKTVDDYAEFEKLWENGGGKVMTEEANQILTEREEMYKEIGIK